MFCHQGNEVDDLLSPFQICRLMIVQGWICTEGQKNDRERERMQREGGRDR